MRRIVSHQIRIDDTQLASIDNVTLITRDTVDTQREMRTKRYITQLQTHFNYLINRETHPNYDALFLVIVIVHDTPSPVAVKLVFCCCILSQLTASSDFAFSIRPHAHNDIL